MPNRKRVNTSETLPCDICGKMLTGKALDRAVVTDPYGIQLHCTWECQRKGHFSYGLNITTADEKAAYYMACQDGYRERDAKFPPRDGDMDYILDHAARWDWTSNRIVALYKEYTSDLIVIPGMPRIFP